MGGRCWDGEGKAWSEEEEDGLGCGQASFPQLCAQDPTQTGLHLYRPL